MISAITSSRGQGGGGPRGPQDPDAPAPDPDADVLTFAEWANRWYASLELAPSTMENYRQHLELHILRHLQEKKMTATGFLSVDVDVWEKKLRAEGRPENSIRSYRATLSACLEAAVPALLPSNPAHRKPNTGKRTGKKGGQRAAENSEKAITNDLRRAADRRADGDPERPG